MTTNASECGDFNGFGLRQSENAISGPLQPTSAINGSKAMPNSVERLIVFGSCNSRSACDDERRDGASGERVTSEEGPSHTPEGALKVDRGRFLTSMLADAVEGDVEGAAAHSHLMQLHDKLAMSETLAQNSMLMSPAAKRRLMARKLEMLMKSDEFERSDATDDYIPPADVLMYLVRYATAFIEQTFSGRRCSVAATAAQ